MAASSNHGYFSSADSIIISIPWFVSSQTIKKHIPMHPTQPAKRVQQ
jgi:hypothetical protein